MPTNTTPTRPTAAAILRAAIRIGQPDLLAEILEGHPNETELRGRLNKAFRLDFLVIDAGTGLVRLTPKGEQYLADHPAVTP